MRKIAVFITALLFSAVSVFAQTQVKGKVTDAKGAPLEGATVKVRGENTSTVTKADGSFEILVKAGKSLEISEVGYTPQIIQYSGSGDLSVQLTQDSKSLSEVVVTGTGFAINKKKVSFAVQSISADKLPPTPSASIDQALIGKVAGAQISSIDGTPGARVNILLRGINTIQQGTRPMILVDGAELAITDINALDLSNVERVEVVQGAAAASLYGANGANGVIQIFTKKGRAGKASIEYSSSVSSNSYINSGNVHKARFHSFATDASGNILDGNTGLPIKLYDDGAYADANSGTGVTWAYGSDPAAGFPTAMSNPKNIYNKEYKGNTAYYDHFKQLFDKGFTFNNSLNISGGSEKSDYALTLSSNRQKSNIVNNGKVDRTNITANIGGELFKGFKIRSITQLVYTRNTIHPGYGAQRNNIYSMLNTSPFFDLTKRNPDGGYAVYPTAGTVSVNAQNPYHDLESSSGLDNTYDIIQNLQASFKVNKFIELDAKYTINYQSDLTKYVYKNQSKNLSAQNWGSWTSNYNADNANGEVNKFTFAASSQNFLGSAFIRTNFERDFHSKLPITTTTQLGWDYRHNKSDNYGVYGKELRSFPTYTLDQTKIQAVAYDRSTDFVTFGYLLNQTIDYGELAGIAAGFRTDYSSAFGKGAKPFTFPHFSGYFRPSALNFWDGGKLGNVLPDFKIRAAYGEAGIQPLAYDRLLTVATQNVGSDFGISLPKSFRNLDINVETSQEFEIGTDLTLKLAKGKWLSGANMSFSSWSRKSNGVIYGVSVAPSSGGGTSKDNAISISSKGVEFSLNLSVLKTKDFTWDFTTNWGHQSSMIDKIKDGAVIPPITFSGGSTTLNLTAGEKIGQLYGYIAFRSVDQINQVTGKPYIDKADQGKYQIVNGYLVDTLTKAIQFTLDKYPFGDPNPKFNSSFINSFTYKNYLNFSFQLDWVYGSHLYNQTKEWMYRDGIHGDYDVPVTINGQTAAYTAYYRSVYAAEFGNLNGDRNATKDYFYEDASFLRLRNVSVAFDFAKAFNIPKFKKLQLVFTGRNIWTKTKYTGFDPEVSSGTVNSAFERGVDHNSMPNVKSYQVGLNLGF
jgi:TonB-dependent starch-binding outer membrane protein SusC